MHKVAAGEDREALRRGATFGSVRSGACPAAELTRSRGGGGSSSRPRRQAGELGMSRTGGSAARRPSIMPVRFWEDVSCTAPEIQYETPSTIWSLMSGCCRAPRTK